MRVICNFNDPSNIPSDIPDNFDFGLELGKEYLVMGILTYKDSNAPYFLVDENGRPSWFPIQVFEISNNRIPHNWFLKINMDDDYVDYHNLLSFEEMCNNEDFFNQLLLRDEETMRLYFKRKMELETSLLVK